MANILLVAQNKNFITSALVHQLEKQEHSVFVVSDEWDKLQEIQNDMDMVLLCADNIIAEELRYIKDRVIEEKLPFFVIGESDALREVMPIIPVQFITKHFVKPIHVKEVAAFIGTYQQEEASQPKKKILVVDDSGAMLRSIKGWLQDKYRLMLANSGASAIKCLASNRPDLILLDYEMPVCDGKQVLEMIRAEEEYADIPVMFLTNKSDKEAIDSVNPLNPEGYLIKIMEPRCIIQSIDNYFKREEIMNTMRP